MIDGFMDLYGCQNLPNCMVYIWTGYCMSFIPHLNFKNMVHIKVWISYFLDNPVWQP